MSSWRDLVLLAAWSMLGFAVQLAGTYWGLPGALMGGALCGAMLWLGQRLLAFHFLSLWPLPAAALLSSCAGVGCTRLVHAGDGVMLVWLAPLVATLPTGVPSLLAATRGSRCALCHRALRGTLSFPCPRCAMQVCEYCWEYGRDRCRLCETNHIALLPSASAWWADRFGERRLHGVCSSCHTSASGSHTPQWACGHCAHNQCEGCWDDSSGVCSRCGWILPDLDSEDHVHPGHAPTKDDTYA